ncbi:testis-expressed protein 9 isoform X2 [Clupea harengus]|uniref:Testis-expressed protein 9 isoform X2 n=1 Tax=Clupea harengus TaxID=7950 RepID=A0A6P8FN72_CLUHA|nr:testis-expressed protein 9 isoform X2 [Clupea harengus]
MTERTSSAHMPKKPHSAGIGKSLSRPANRPVSAPPKEKPKMDIFAKEEEYKRLNAELEAKTAEIVRQAEEVMREQNEVLSKPVSSHLDIEDEEDLREAISITHSEKTTAKSVRKTNALKPSKPLVVNKKRSQKTKVNETAAESVAVIEDFGDFSLAKTISNIEGKLNDGVFPEDLEDDVMPSVGEEMGSEAQIRFLKAKLRVMQEELERLSFECNKKDDENSALSSKLKQTEEDRSRLQRTTTIQQSQIEKHRAMAEEANRRGHGLQQQVTSLQKEIDGLKRADKQAANSHSATEVRLNRALEEAEKYKMQLNKIKQTTKDTAHQEHQIMEALQAENKKLEKQKAELIVGFKKQIKLIDLLKRQKMHFEAAKMLSFTEEEFMKALDWGKS